MSDSALREGEYFTFYCRAVPDASIIKDNDPYKNNIAVEFTAEELSGHDFKGLPVKFDHNKNDSAFLGRVVEKIASPEGGINFLVEIPPITDTSTKDAEYLKWLKDTVVTNIINGRLNRVSLAHQPYDPIDTPTGFVQAKEIRELSISNNNYRMGSDILTHRWSKEPYMGEKHANLHSFVTGVEVVFEDTKNPSTKNSSICNSAPNSLPNKQFSAQMASNTAPLVPPPPQITPTGAPPAPAPPGGGAAQAPAAAPPTTVVPKLPLLAPKPPASVTAATTSDLARDFETVMLNNQRLREEAKAIQEKHQKELNDALEKAAKYDEQKALVDSLLPYAEQYQKLIIEQHNEKKKRIIDDLKAPLEETTKRLRLNEQVDAAAKEQADQLSQNTQVLGQVAESLLDKASTEGQVTLGFDDLHNLFNHYRGPLMACNAYAEKVSQQYQQLHSQKLQERAEEIIKTSPIAQKPAAATVPAPAPLVPPVVSMSQPQQQQQQPPATLKTIDANRLLESLKSRGGLGHPAAPASTTTTTNQPPK